MTLEATTEASAADVTTGPALATRDLRCAIGRNTILRDLNFEVRRGEVLGLVGANGTGKSTLLCVLAGIRRPAAGHVLLDGRPLSSFRSHERARRVAFVAQEEAAHTDLLVGEMVALGRLPYARAWGGLDPGSRDAVHNALEQVDLAYAVNQPLDQLSGGERRRTLIARGLAQETPLLLLDEPTNHLDIRHQLALARSTSSTSDPEDDREQG